MFLLFSWDLCNHTLVRRLTTLQQSSAGCLFSCDTSTTLTSKELLSVHLRGRIYFLIRMLNQRWVRYQNKPDREAKMSSIRELQTTSVFLSPFSTSPSCASFVGDRACQQWGARWQGGICHLIYPSPANSDQGPYGQHVSDGEASGAMLLFFSRAGNPPLRTPAFAPDTREGNLCGWG